MTRRLGIAATVLGLAIVLWATMAVGSHDIDEADQVIITGPYAHSRHPMYVGWTLIYLGITLVLNAGWLLSLFPVLLVLVHTEIRREEANLVKTFGSQYEGYRQRVRRYL